MKIRNIAPKTNDGDINAICISPTCAGDRCYFVAKQPISRVYFEMTLK